MVSTNFLCDMRIWRAPRVLISSISLNVLGVLCALCCVSFAVVEGAGPPGSDTRVLVVTDGRETATSHARLFDSLRSRGYTLEIRAAGDDDIALWNDGEYLYGGLALLCPTSKAVARSLPIASIEEFIDSGRSVFLAAAPNFSEHTQAVAQAVGVDLDERDALVIDHQRIVSELDNGTATYIRAGGQTKSPFLFGESAAAASSSAGAGADIVFRGPGAQLFSDNELIDSVIWGSGSSFAYKTATLVTTSPHASGTATVLGAALSTRAGGRVAYFGSLDALSDKVFDIAGAAHEEALITFLSWTFGHSGVLRTQNLQYSVEDRPEWKDNGVRVKDTIALSLQIQSWNGDKGEWVDFVADDVQVEFVMLNPWVRTRLHYTGSNATYTAEIPVPDQIGVYKFAIAYHRPGVSAIDVQHVVPVRPFLHNEYPRFIPMAYPYYASAFLMLVVVFLLGLVLMYGNPELIYPTGEKESQQSPTAASPAAGSRSKTSHKRD